MVSCLSTSLTVLLWPLPLIPAHLPSMYSLRLRKAAAEAEGQAYPQHGDLRGVGLATAQSHPPPQVLDGDDDS